jgi:preprotein translocase subunit SecE
MSMDGQKPKTSLVEFIRETQHEIAKVSWPTRKETVQTTIAIVVMALIAGLFFLAVDTGLGYVISHILGMNSK